MRTTAERPSSHGNTQWTNVDCSDYDRFGGFKRIVNFHSDLKLHFLGTDRLLAVKVECFVYSSGGSSSIVFYSQSS